MGNLDSNDFSAIIDPLKEFFQVAFPYLFIRVYYCRFLALMFFLIH